MKAMLALIGGEEFTDGFNNVHQILMELCANIHHRYKHPLKIVFLPTCAADDGRERVMHWCEQARQRLQFFGAQVLTPMIVDRDSANNPEYAEQIAAADWIYIGGGYPHVAMRIISGTLAEKSLRSALYSAALISGASAGAMLLCSQSWIISPEFDAVVSQAIREGSNMEGLDFPSMAPLDCLGFIPNSLCWPHFNQFFSMNLLKSSRPAGVTTIGIDELTAIVTNSEGCWQVVGRGSVEIIDSNFQSKIFQPGMQFFLPPDS